MRSSRSGVMQGAKEIKRGGKLSGSAGRRFVSVLRPGMSPAQYIGMGFSQEYAYGVHFLDLIPYLTPRY